MKRSLSWLMALALICTPVVAVEIDVSAADIASCKDKGGCVLITEKALKNFAVEAYEMGYMQCKTDVRNRT